MNFDVKWILTTLIALWGAGLSTWQLIVRWKETAPHVNVLLSEFVWQGSNPPRPVLAVEVLNVGRVDVKLDRRPCALQPKGEGLLEIDDDPVDRPYPQVLEAGSGFTIRIPKHRYADLLGRGGKDVRLRAVLTDAIRRQYVSRWVTVNFRVDRVQPDHR